MPGAVAGERAGHAVVVDGRIRECAGDLAAQQRPWRHRAESIQPDSAPARQFDGRHGRARARPNPADPPVYAPGGGEHEGTPAGVEGDDLEPPCG